MPLRPKCHSTFLKRNHWCRIQHSRHTRLYSNSCEPFVWVSYSPESYEKLGDNFSVLYFATYWGLQIHISLHSSFVLTVFVRRRVNENKIWNLPCFGGLIQAGLAAIEWSHQRFPWLPVTSLMKTFWTFWSSAFHMKRNNDPAFEKHFGIARNVDINHCYTSLQGVRNKMPF